MPKFDNFQTKINSAFIGINQMTWNGLQAPKTGSFKVKWEMQPEVEGTSGYLLKVIGHSNLKIQKYNGNVCMMAHGNPKKR